MATDRDHPIRKWPGWSQFIQPIFWLSEAQYKNMIKSVQEIRVFRAGPKQSTCKMKAYNLLAITTITKILLTKICV